MKQKSTNQIVNLSDTINEKIKARLGHRFGPQDIIEALKNIDISVNHLPTESNEDIIDNDLSSRKNN